MMPVLEGEVSMSTSEATHELSVTLSGIVDRIVQTAGDSAKAQITIKDADDLYREIRIPNAFHDGKGPPVAVEEGSEVEITIRVRAKRN